MSTRRVAIETPRGTILSGDVLGTVHDDRAERVRTFLRVAVETDAGRAIYRVEKDAVSTHE